jgi:hypothetical protein
MVLAVALVVLAIRLLSKMVVLAVPVQETAVAAGVLPPLLIVVQRQQVTDRVVAVVAAPSPLVAALDVKVLSLSVIRHKEHL